MKILTDYKDLVGKTIAFAHMAQFAEQITLATTDGEVLLAAFDYDDESDEMQIRIYPEHKTIQTIEAHSWLRESLGALGIFDLDKYRKEQLSLQEKRREEFLKKQAQAEIEMYEKLKTKFENKKSTQ